MLNKCFQDISSLEEKYLDEIISESLAGYEARWGSYSNRSFSTIAGSEAGEGPPIAMFILAFYRKFTARCASACTGDLACKYQCQLRAATNIVAALRRNKSRCRLTPKPNKCEKGLQKEYIKWQQRAGQIQSRLAAQVAKKQIKLRKQRVKQAAKGR